MNEGKRQASTVARAAPKAARKDHRVEIHGETREDPYRWLREKDDPEVIEYLEAENAYTDAQMKDTESLQGELFQEMRARIKEADISAAVEIDGFFYYTRTEADHQYPIFCRKEQSMESQEEILLDQNELARGHEHCALGAFEVSPDHRLLAYALDTDGSEDFRVFVREIESGELLDEELESTAGDLEWIEDSSRIVYTTLDAAKRPDKVWLHQLGEHAEDDKQIYEEADQRFFVGLSKARSKQYIFIASESKITSEVRFFDAASQDPEPAVVAVRRQGHEYAVEHRGEEFFILTNDIAKNFRLVRAPVAMPDEEHWQEVFSAQDEVTLEGFDVFADFLCVYELVDGLTRVRVRELEDGKEHTISFDEPVYELAPGSNPNFNTDSLRLVYSTLVSPRTVFDYDMNTGERESVKVEEVFGGHDPEGYEIRREYAEADDGTSIPISIAHKRGLPMDGSSPCWLVGYGAYGMVPPAGFRSTRLSLLERGFVFAIAHVRGGGEKGRGWYEDGKFLKKQNTFGDYAAVAEHMIHRGYTSSEKLLGCGRSAGGLLIGAIANQRPELFGALIADVPFVDTLNTMLDPTIPLTVIEYEEWGNPNDLEYYEYMSSYSPYDNVAGRDRPPMLVTAGLNDPRVAYWEPAKWVAALRASKTDENPLLLKTEMEQGHAGASGRYTFLEETAREYAFSLKNLNELPT